MLIQNEFNKISGKKQFLDIERLLSNFIRFLKLSLRLLSKTFYLKIKIILSKKINIALNFCVIKYKIRTNTCTIKYFRITLFR